MKQKSFHPILCKTTTIDSWDEANISPWEIAKTWCVAFSNGTYREAGMCVDVVVVVFNSLPCFPKETVEISWMFGNYYCYMRICLEFLEWIEKLKGYQMSI